MAVACPEVGKRSAEEGLGAEVAANDLVESTDLRKQGQNPDAKRFPGGVCGIWFFPTPDLSRKGTNLNARHILGWPLKNQIRNLKCEEV